MKSKTKIIILISFLLITGSLFFVQKAEAAASSTFFITTTGTGTWIVPSDWNNASNTIEVIGGGGGGDGSAAGNGNGGGGGGAYAKISNFNAGASSSLNIWVGAGGGPDQNGDATYFNGPGTTPSSTCVVGGSVCAKGGREGAENAGGEGGNATSTGSIGTVINAGGNGGSGNGASDQSGGGGGAGGPAGAGKHGGNGHELTDTSSGGGGGGGGGGGSSTNGSNGLGTAGGAGGAGYNGDGGGASNGAATLNAGGGGGGQNGANGGNGSSSQWWAANPNKGPGGGGGGGGDNCSGNGGNGGLYGAGGGACEGTGGSGAQGIIVIQYIPLLRVTLGTTTVPSNVTIAPGGSATLVDQFTLRTTTSTFTPTSIIVKLAENTTSGIFRVEITNSDGTIVYGSSTNPTANSFSISLSGLTATSSTSTLGIYITPKAHVDMPVVPGSLFSVTSTVTSIVGTGMDFVSTTDDGISATVAIDNLSPVNPTNATGTAGTGEVSLSWVNSGDSDYATTTVLRSSASAIGSTAPTEGIDYATSTAINATTTVACVVGGAASANVTCIDTGLTGGVAYHYKIFTEDSRQNYSTGTVPTGSPLTPVAATISVSGTCKQFDQSTNCADGENIRVARNGTLDSASTTTSGGAWTISGVTQPTSGDVVTVFVTSTTATVRAGAITYYSGSGNISGIQLFERHLVLGATSSQVFTNASTSVFDNSVAGDSNVFWDVDASNNLDVDVGNLFSDERLLVRSGNTFQPDSSGAQKVVRSANFYASSTATTTLNGSIMRLDGSFINNGNFVAGTSTVEFSSSSSVLNCSGCNFYNMTASGTATLTASSSFGASSTLSVVGTLSIGSGLTVSSTGSGLAFATTTLTGTISGAGTIVFNASSSGPGTGGTLSSQVRYDATDKDIASSTFDARTYGGLVELYASSASARVIFATTTTYTFSGGLNLLAGAAGNITLQATTSNPAVDINGALDFTGGGSGSETIQSGTGLWTVSTNADFTGGTYTATAGNTLRMDGTGTLTMSGNKLWNFETNSAGTVTLESGATTTVQGNLAFTGTTPVFTNTTILMTSSSATVNGGGFSVNNLIASSTGTISETGSNLTVLGALTITTSTTFDANGFVLTFDSASASLNLNGTLSGSNVVYASLNTFPTTGTSTASITFNNIYGSQTIPVRSYGGGLITVGTSGSSNTTTTLGTAPGQTIDFSGGLSMSSGGPGIVTLDGRTNNPTINITGNFDASAAGTKIVMASSSTWTVTGNFNISNSGTTFQAPNGTLAIGGNYTNTGGTFTHDSGTVVLNGSSQQTLSGTMYGSSAFSTLQITNNSGSEATPSIVFNATTTAATSTITVGTSTIQFNASSTFTFTNINWDGQATSTRIKLRSSVGTSTNWFLNVPESGTQIVLNVDAKDSDASLGNEINATSTTNYNSGGNTNWVFTIVVPTVTSTANDIFEVNQATTTISNINIMSGAGTPGGKIASTTDIRIKIPSGLNAVWDPTIASVTCATGTACAKINTSGVTYESSNSIVVIDVVQSFTNGQWVQISGLKMGNFTAVSASTSTTLRVDGSGDATDDATDTGTKTVKGTMSYQDHGMGQVSNLFVNTGTFTSSTVFRFRLVPTGESMTMTTTTVTISNVSGLVSSEITNAILIQDVSGNGSFDVGEPQLGATGTTTIASASGTIIFGGSWTATTTSDILLLATISNINDGDNLKFELLSSDIYAQGVTSTLSISISGSSTSINHGAPRREAGGGGSSGVFEGNPPESGSVGGGGSGGGGGQEGGGPPGGDGSQGGGNPGGGGGEAP